MRKNTIMNTGAMIGCLLSGLTALSHFVFIHNLFSYTYGLLLVISIFLVWTDKSAGYIILCSNLSLLALMSLTLTVYKINVLDSFEMSHWLFRSLTFTVFLLSSFAIYSLLPLRKRKIRR